MTDSTAANGPDGGGPDPANRAIPAPREEPRDVGDGWADDPPAAEPAPGGRAAQGSPNTDGPASSAGSAKGAGSPNGGDRDPAAGTESSEQRDAGVPRDTTADAKRSVRDSDRSAYSLLGVPSHKARTHHGDNVSVSGGSTFVGGDQYQGDRNQTNVHLDGDVTFGDKVGRDKLEGDHVQGDKHVYQFGPPAPAAGPIPGPQVEAMLRGHVSPKCFEEVVRRLDRDGLVVLAGPRNTGRRHTAIAALAGQPSAGRRVHLLPSGFRPGALPKATGQDKNETTGYLLDATGKEWISRPDLAETGTLIAEVTGSAAENGRRARRMVIITDDENISDVWRAYVVQYQPPAALMILLSHLQERHGLTDSLDWETRARAFPEVSETLDRMRDPWDAAAQAEAIGQWAHDPRWTEDPDQPAGRSGAPRTGLAREQALRAMARELLSADGRTPKAQGFVLAAAVLDREAENDVIIAARNLTERLHNLQSSDDPPATEVFGEPLRLWLPHASVSPPLESESRFDEHAVLLSEAEKDRPRVLLREPMLAGTVLELTWQEYEGTRRPILRWLEWLCTWPDPTVRLRAAYAVARLASLDFPTVWEFLLRPWTVAKQPDVYLIEAAGRVLEGVVLRSEANAAAGRPGERTPAQRSGEAAVELLTTWSWSDRWPQVMAVLQAYAGPIGQARSDEALRAVDRILARHGHQHGQRVSEVEALLRDRIGQVAEWTLAQMFRFGGEDEVLEHLLDWQDSYYSIRDHASGAFLHCATQGWEAESGELVPVLCALVTSDRLRFDELETLWRGALLSLRHRRRAWRWLRVWHDVLRRDPPPKSTAAEIHAVIENLLLQLGAHRELRVPMRHHQEIWNPTASPRTPRRRRT